MTDSYISIDLETTGLSPKRDKIIEIGAVKIAGGREKARFSSLINPGRRLDERISRLTGITDSDLEQAPPLDQVFAGLLTFLEDLPLLGHRILFDYSFLKKAALDRKLEFEKNGIDTLKIARICLPALEHKNLDYLCAYYGIPIKAHRAMEDAAAASALYLRLAQEFGQAKGGLFEPEKLCSQIKRDVPATKRQKERLYRLIELHKIKVDYSVEGLTRSEASRFTDKILSVYGR